MIYEADKDDHHVKEDLGDDANVEGIANLDVEFKSDLCVGEVSQKLNESLVNEFLNGLPFVNEHLL